MNIPRYKNVHLTYCLNVHPGESIAEVEEAVFEKAATVFAEVEELTGTRGPFGLGVWLSAAAAAALDEPAKLAEFKHRLTEAGFYVFTLNGFPYGKFHGTRVKQAVYRPDWSDPRRLRHTKLLARILASLLPEGVDGSISTVPITYREWADDATVEAATRNLSELAASLSELKESVGKVISVALEPEPDCFLEGTDDVVGFFTKKLLPEGVRSLSERHGFSRPEAEGVLRRHVGVCLDAIHAAVIFEDPAEAIRRSAENGIRVCKVHLGAALKAEVGAGGPPEALGAFQDDVYLHQVKVRTPDGDVRFPDLPEALAGGADLTGEWRVHYHVPLTWEGASGISTTRNVVDQDFIRTALGAGVEHFEVETYTLSVFPNAYASPESILAKDLAWVIGRIRDCQASGKA